MYDFNTPQHLIYFPVVWVLLEQCDTL